MLHNSYKKEFFVVPNDVILELYSYILTSTATSIWPICVLWVSEYLIPNQYSILFKTYDHVDGMAIVINIEYDKVENRGIHMLV